jgi:hypothetical protein
MSLLTVKPANVLRGFYFAAGLGAAAAAYGLTARGVWGGAASVARAHGTLPPAPRPGANGGGGDDGRLFGASFRQWAAGQWNGAVDATLGNLAKWLGERGL